MPVHKDNSGRPIRRPVLLAIIPSYLAAPLEISLSIIQRPGADVLVHSPVVLLNLLGYSLALCPKFLALVSIGAKDPFFGSGFKSDCNVFSFPDKSVSALGIRHGCILTRNGLLVLVFPVFVSSELFDQSVGGNELLQVLSSVGKVYFGRDDGVQPSMNDSPARCFVLSVGFVSVNVDKKNALAGTFEHPGGVVDENEAKGFGIVGFKAHYHELDGDVVHVRQCEAGEVKDETLCSAMSAMASGEQCFKWYCLLNNLRQSQQGGSAQIDQFHTGTLCTARYSLHTGQMPYGAGPGLR